MPRILHPLPLLDEQAFLSACANADPPIAHTHATSVWKALLRAELDQYHPGYAERLASRLASRSASRAASRTASRRPSIGSAASPSSAAETKQRIAEGDEDETDDASQQQEEKKQGRDFDDEAEAAATSAPAATSALAAEAKSAAAVEADVSAVPKAAAVDDKTAAAAPLSPSASESSESASHTSSAAHFAEEAAAAAAAARKLEAEDDARLEGLSVFPRSRFAPSEAELQDPQAPVHQLRAVTQESVPRLPQRLYPLLADKFSLLTSRLQSHKTSADGSTTKLLIRLQDGQHIESVIMRHKQSDVNGRVEQRITLCVSSQVGCAMACSFCATGTMGMRSNLMSGEILEQLLIANRFERIRNIVFMGMGEPLKNYEAVLSTIRAMTDPSRFGLAPSRITLSTVGVIPRMLDLTRDIPAVQLALSLHAPTQELRQQIVPTAKAYPLEKLIDAAQYYIDRSKKRILIEYVMLDGVNASLTEAHQLGKLLKGMEVMINLIPYNSTAVKAQYHAPSKQDTQNFQQVLAQQYGLFTTTRIEMGADIDGACGQLALENQSSIQAAASTDDAVAAAAYSSAVRPRGLVSEDDAAVSEDLLSSSPAAAASSGSGCATSSSGADIEDLQRGGGAGGDDDSAAGPADAKQTAKQRAAAIMAKRRAANAAAAAAASSVATAAASVAPTEAATPAAAASTADASSSSDDEDGAFLSPAEVAKLRLRAAAGQQQPPAPARGSTVLEGSQWIVLAFALFVGMALLHDSGAIRWLRGS